MEPISYLQWDSRWKNIVYTSTGDKSQTIGNSGCGPTCAAMVVATLKDHTQTPVEACAFAKKYGYRTANSGTSYGFFTKYLSQYGIVCEQITDSRLDQMAATKAAPIRSQLIAHLKNGGWAICCMGKGLWTSSGHFILAYGVSSDGAILIRDPNSTKFEKTHGDRSAFLSQIKHVFLIKNIKEDDMTEAEVLKIIKKNQNYIADIKDAPVEFQSALTELKNSGILKGTGAEEVGMTLEGVRQLIITKRMIDGVK